MGKQKQRSSSRVNPEFKNLVRRLKRPPLTTDWHCIGITILTNKNLAGMEVPKNDILPYSHSILTKDRKGDWWWVVSDPAYILWTKYNQQYKAWCKVR